MERENGRSARQHTTQKPETKDRAMKMRKTKVIRTTGLAFATVIVTCVLVLGTTVTAVAAKKKDTASAAEVSAPAAPQGVVAAAIDPGVSIDWQPLAEGGVSGYNVYFLSGKNWKKFNHKLLTGTHYYDPEGTVGMQYAVSAVSDSRVESDLTIVVAVATCPVLYEEDSPKISVEGTWEIVNCPGASACAVVSSGVSGSILRFRFTGRQVKLIATNNNGCGWANVYIDNQFTAVVDLYSPETVYGQVEADVAGLEYGEHEVTVLVLGYGNPEGVSNNVNVDAFEVR
jgi:hypothetical protein